MSEVIEEMKKYLGIAKDMSIQHDRNTTRVSI